jgi:hypothetical protein
VRHTKEASGQRTTPEVYSLGKRLARLTSPLEGHSTEVRCPDRLSCRYSDPLASQAMLMQVALRGRQVRPRHSGVAVVMQRAAGAPGEPPSDAMDDHRALSSASAKAVGWWWWWEGHIQLVSGMLVSGMHGWGCGVLGKKGGRSRQVYMAGGLVLRTKTVGAAVLHLLRSRAAKTGAPAEQHPAPHTHSTRPPALERPHPCPHSQDASSHMMTGRST